MQTEGIVDGIVKVLLASGRVAFAVLLTGVVVLIGKAYALWPFALIPDDQIYWAGVAAVFGAGLLIASMLIGGWSKGVDAWETLSERAQQRKKLKSAPNRTEILTGEELAAMAFLLYHDFLGVEAPYNSIPFYSLVRKGFLITTDGEAPRQMLRINPALFAKRDQVIERAVKRSMKITNRDEPPWHHSA